jgi:hypothetical protein
MTESRYDDGRNSAEHEQSQTHHVIVDNRAPGGTPTRIQILVVKILDRPPNYNNYRVQFREPATS